jgi:hypothetical protein
MRMLTGLVGYTLVIITHQLSFLALLPVRSFRSLKCQELCGLPLCSTCHCRTSGWSVEVGLGLGYNLVIIITKTMMLTGLRLGHCVVHVIAGRAVGLWK